MLIDRIAKFQLLKARVKTLTILYLNNKMSLGYRARPVYIVI